MKKKKLYTLLTATMFAAGGMLTTSCSVDNPLDEEQYVKKIYLVGASEQLQQKEVDYAGNGGLYVSVAIGGSIKPDHDVSVTLGLADQKNIDNYNYKNVVGDNVRYRALDEAWYNVPSWTGTIKADSIYTRIPMTVDVTKISCDSLYVIPLEIKSVSDYQKVTADTVLLVNIKMVNKYSGNYTFEGNAVRYDNGKPVYTDSHSVSTARTATAVDGNTIRLYSEVNIEKLTNLDDYAYTITINADNTLTVKPWKNLAITAGGGSYDPEKESFKLWYEYTDNGKTYRMEATLTK